MTIVDDMTLADENSADAKVIMKVLSEFAKHFQKKDFDDIFKRVTKFYEKGRFRNWYNGLSKIPFGDPDNVTLSDEIETYAESGEISTPFFGKQFDIDKFSFKALFKLSVKNPYMSGFIYSDALSITLTLKYDIADHENNYVGIFCGISHLDEGFWNGILNTYKHEFTLERKEFTKCDVSYIRSTSMKKMYFVGTKKFPGLNIKWAYDYSGGNITGYDKMSYKVTKISQLFIKVVNLVHTVGASSKDDLMHLAMEKKSSGIALGYLVEYESIWKMVSLKFNESAINVSELFNEDISDETLETAAEVFIYILAQSEDYLFRSYAQFKYWLLTNSLRRSLSTYIKILPNN